METNSTSKSRLSKATHIGVLLVIVIAALIFFKEILKPLAGALIVWYIIRALQNFIGGIKVKGRIAPRWLSGPLSLIIISLILQITI